MESFKPEHYERRHSTCEGWDIGVTSYKLRDVYYCKIDNVDPGATVARASAPTREAAEAEALRKAQSRLALTRRIRTTREVLTTMQASVQLLTTQLEELEKASQNLERSDTELTAVSSNTPNP